MNLFSDLKKKKGTMLRITGIFYQKLLHKITIKKIKRFLESKTINL